MRRTASRFALAVLLGLFLAGCAGGGTDVSASDVTAAAVCAQYPTSGTSCSSPDGAFSVTFIGAQPRGSIHLFAGGSGGVMVYHSTNGCCTDMAWAKPHTLLFDDDYQLIRLDPVTRKHRIISDWSDFVVSPDGRWIAGWAYSGGDSVAPPETVGVLSIDGKTCLSVPHSSNESDEAAGFTQDGKSVIVTRRPFDPGEGVTSSSIKLVAYPISSLPASKDCYSGIRDSS
jgi:hypothetical protein